MESFLHQFKLVANAKMIAQEYNIGIEDNFDTLYFGVMSSFTY